MKQLVTIYTNGELRLEEVPVPRAGRGFVVVRNACSVVSAGTELMKVRDAGRTLIGKALERPEQVRKVVETARQMGVKAAYDKAANRLAEYTPLGYSCCGVVVEAGEGAGWREGDWVACGGAEFANHAEYVRVPKNLCVALPAGVSPEEGAFATIGAIAMQALRQAGVALGETVAVIGLGLLGQIAVQLLHAAGCRVIGIDIDERRIERARSFGILAGFHPDADDVAGQVRRVTGGVGADATLITAGGKSNRPVELAAEIARDRGRVVDVGIISLNVPWKPYYEKELSLVMSRSYGPGRYDAEYELKGADYPVGYVRWTEGRNMAAFLDLLQARRIRMEPLVTHRFEFDRSAEALRRMSENREGEDYVGVVFTYPAAPAPPAADPFTVRLRPIKRGAVNVGVIGAGNFMKTMILPHLARDRRAALVGIATTRGVSSRNTAARFGFAYCATDSERILGDETIDTVFIGTRHDAHARLTLAALQAGKNVFVEKPLAMNRGELDAFRTFYRDHPAAPRLMVGYNRRFAPAARQAKAFIGSRTGPLLLHYRINAGSLEPGSWYLDPEEGGGRIVGEVCHFVDLLQYLTDSTVVDVAAAAPGTGPGTAAVPNENLAATLRFADGSVGTILYTDLGHNRFPKERLEVFAGGKVVVLDNFNSLELYGRRGRRQVNCRHDKGHRDEVAAFLAAVADGSESPIDVPGLLHTSEVVFRIIEACRAAPRDSGS